MIQSPLAAAPFNPEVWKAFLVWLLGFCVMLWAFMHRDIGGKISLGFFILGAAIMALATFVL